MTERKVVNRRYTISAFVSFSVAPDEDVRIVQEEVERYFDHKTGLPCEAYVGISSEDDPWVEDIEYETKEQQ